MVCWQATLDDMVTRNDFQLFLSGFVVLWVKHRARELLQQGATRDEVNEHLRTVLMPSMVTLQRDAMGAFSAMLDDPAAPSHKLQ
jgi:hypothetical protein